MWNHPRPRMEPMSPALAGGFLTTGPPGKPQDFLKELSEHVSFFFYILEWRKAFLTMTQNSDRTKEKMDEFVYIKLKTSEWSPPTPRQKKEKEDMERRKHKNREKKTIGKIFISQRANLPITE